MKGVVQIKIPRTPSVPGSRIPRAVKDARKVLESLKYGEILLSPELASSVSICLQKFRDGFSSHPHVAQFRVRWGNRILWGNARTIRDIQSGKIILE